MTTEEHLQVSLIQIMNAMNVLSIFPNTSIMRVIEAGSSVAVKLLLGNDNILRSYVKSFSRSLSIWPFFTRMSRWAKREEVEQAPLPKGRNQR